MHLFALRFSLGLCPVLGLLGHVEIRFLVFFKKPPYWSPLVAVSVFIPTNIVEFCFDRGIVFKE